MINECERKYYEKEKKRIEKTAYIRFDLAERVSKDEKLSTAFSSVLTLYLICSSIALFASDTLSLSPDGRIIGFAGIVASVSLLVTNLLDQSESRILRSRDITQSAQKMLRIAAAMEREIKATEPMREALSDLHDAYHGEIQDLGENHTTWDNSVYEIREKIRHSGWFTKKFLQLKYARLRLQRFICSWWLHLGVSSICAYGLTILAFEVVNLLF